MIFVDSGGSRSPTTDLHAPGSDAATGEAAPSRTMEVYRWALQHQAIVRPIKGDNAPLPGQFIRRGRGIYVHGGAKTPLTLWLLDVHHFQDELVDLMTRETETPALDPKAPAIASKVWQLNRRDDPEYHAHMTNLVKTQVRERNQLVDRWKPRFDGARVDYRACEGYQVAAAYHAGIHLLPDINAWREFLEHDIATRQRTRSDAPGNSGGDRPFPGFTPDGRAFVASNR